VKPIWLPALLILGACGTTVPVNGSTSEGEQFTGELTARGLNYGPLEIRNTAGVSCRGIWQLDQDHAGSMSVTCSDGRTGTTELSAGDSLGTMKGMLGGKPFAGTFEKPAL